MEHGKDVLKEIKYLEDLTRNAMGNGIISSEDAKAKLEELANKKNTFKLNKVLSTHPNKISGSKPDGNGNYTIFRTRAKWCPNGMLSRKYYEDLIEELYAHYFGEEPDFESLTLKECFENWVERRVKAEIISYQTAQHYRCDYKKYIESENFPNKPISEIKKYELIDFYERVVGNGNITAKCFGNIKSCINGAFKYASMYDDIHCINAREIDTSDISRRCKCVDNSDQVYTTEQRDVLLTYLEGLEQQTVYSLAIRLAFCLPTRIGELTAISWEDVNLDTKEITLAHSMVNIQTDSVNRKLVRVDYMKAHSKSGKRIIDLSDYAVEVLNELKALTGDRFYVLNSAGNNPISENNFNSNLKKCCKKCGIPYYSSHKIRFYQCSRMYELQIDEKDIQAEMGHSTLEMTRHYDRRRSKRFTDEKANLVFGR